MPFKIGIQNMLRNSIKYKKYVNIELPYQDLMYNDCFNISSYVWSVKYYNFPINGVKSIVLISAKAEIKLLK